MMHSEDENDNDNGHSGMVADTSDLTEDGFGVTVDRQPHGHERGGNGV